MRNCKIISVDTETLALTPDAVVLSFGAYMIEVDGAGVARVLTGERYYEVLSYHDQLATRLIDAATLEWWAEQGEESQSVLAESKGRPDGFLRQDLGGFVSWLEDIAGEDELYFLAKDPDFDGVILNHLFKEQGVSFPFAYNKRIALRTMAHAYELAIRINATYTEPEIEHNALSDAEAQAEDYCKMHNALASLGGGS